MRRVATRADAVLESVRLSAGRRLPRLDVSSELHPRRGRADAGARRDAGGPPDAGAPTDAGDVCGDGTRGATEACDDGNDAAGDGCSADCLIEEGYRCPVEDVACVAIVCGDGRIETPETCDDGNAAAGDGCSEACRLEPGWLCAVPGVACTAAACGDGFVADLEECDDGDTEAGDGCAPDCTLEAGFACEEMGGGCRPTTCGDGVPEGTEQCDDGNDQIGDGCTPFCEREPTCDAEGCRSVCGDGQVFPGEACDDANARDGDGCSSTCELEPGFACTVILEEPPAEVRLPIVYRDLRASHPDCQRGGSFETGMVQTELGSDGKPLGNFDGSNANLTTAENFFDWYHDTDQNQTVASRLLLSRLPDGNYEFDSGAFFPLDGLGWASMGEPQLADCGGALHNFHFTSEVRFWFRYQRAAAATLRFRGDDDVWVFINRRLAVDIGGVHGPTAGEITLDASTEGALGLVDGAIYEAAVFQAERQTCGSNYRLTLAGFFAGRTECESVCGDGVVTRDEVCDDGTNDGGYGGCLPDCLGFGPRCGDGEVQTEREACDDGENFGQYDGCSPDCTLGPRCGDGVRQPEEEQCDAGEDNGGGACSEDCTVTLG